ncbi:hypothetical protein Pmani_027705 [Petrolisthes manimaculis]|uniref:leucine--tRNA ligase n=1 Tax=Petrolisthes manimaculis TaxID=1843537 RepID=A0AAE1P3S1_9EUCA|nr:hypothetical protein Pmani_027705 [Petrolisthes manimaculis]
MFTFILTKCLQLRRHPNLLNQHRKIFSRTGVWPVFGCELDSHCPQVKLMQDDILTNNVRKEVDAYWKDKYSLVAKDSTSSMDNVHGQGKKYVLAMFPYPSGKLHMGHVRVYTTSDALARFYRHRGHQVVHPMGWDAFGLPAENAALEHGAQPQLWTYTNITQMKAQLLELGCSLDWHREFATCHPEYYRWTQYIFLKLFHAGLAYQDQALVNWDPVDQTVLADEQVDEAGRSWRSGAAVETRYLTQWFLKITRFSKSLYEGLSNPSLENWRDIPKIQRHWIGECNGYRVEMLLRKRDNRDTKQQQQFVTQPLVRLWMPQLELIHGISFIGVRPGHKLDSNESKAQLRGHYRVLDVIAECPLSHRYIPVIVSDKLPYYDEAEYHVGIPCVSEHDKSIARTCEFDTPNVLNGDTIINSGDLDGLSIEEARVEVQKKLQASDAGGYQTSARLRDWAISRQRYWGTPIPIIHCSQCGAVPVPAEELPVTLPDITTFKGKGASPLKQATDWLNCKCPRCGSAAERETDTMDTFVDSSWYFLRFLDPNNSNLPFTPEAQAALMPVNVYIGGKEHAVLHLLYARFMQHFLASEGLVDTLEPFTRLVMLGQVKSDSYRVKTTGAYLAPHQVNFSVSPPVARDSGEALEIISEKMSKSKKNGVDPQELLEEYGTDTTRLLMLADVAPTSERIWSSDTFPGNLKWQHRLWLTVGEFIHARQSQQGCSGDSFLSSEEEKSHRQQLWEVRNWCIYNVTRKLNHSHSPSAAIKFMQTLTATLRNMPVRMIMTKEYEEALRAQIIMLSPLIPYFASELWAGFCSVATSTSTQKDRGLLEQAWPEVDEHYPLPLFYKIPDRDVQLVKVPRKALERLTNEEAFELISKEEEFQQYLVGRTVTDTQLAIIKGLNGHVRFSFKIHDKVAVQEQRKKLRAEKKKEKKLKQIKRAEKKKETM